MEFVRLGAYSAATYIPDKLIEGYKSLIWTERFQGFGDFELKSYDVKTIESLLPEKTLVSHLETGEVMRVETHSIEMEGEGADAVPVITVLGRSVSSLLEDRFMNAEYQKKRTMRMAYTASSALCVLLFQAFDNNHGVDVTRAGNVAWTTRDDIPNVCVSEKIATHTPARWWQFDAGLVWPQFEKLLVDADLGIRTVRPAFPNSATRVTVDAVLATRGTVRRTAAVDLPELRFEIYQGVDRSATVQFSDLQGHLDNPRYLKSAQGYKSVVKVIAGGTTVPDIYRAGEIVLDGWDHKAIVYDAGSPELPEEPTKPEDLPKNPTEAQKAAYWDDIDEWKNARAQWNTEKWEIFERLKDEAQRSGQALLKQNRRLDMFSADVSELSPYKYRTHYELGDTVTLVGERNKTAKMIVNEYVRTEDENGDRGFPSLVLE